MFAYTYIYAFNCPYFFVEDSTLMIYDVFQIIESLFSKRIFLNMEVNFDLLFLPFRIYCCFYFSVLFLHQVLLSLSAGNSFVMV